MIQESTEGRVRVLRLDRPEARNALSADLRAHLIEALEAAEADDGVGAIVLTGEGKCFAAGADLRELLARTSHEQRSFLEPPHIYSVIEGLAKPVIAAINGHALGAGLELATACDMRVAAPGAKLGQPEIHLALLPGGGGTQRLVQLLGHGQAAKLVLTGDAVSAEEALRIGLVDAVDDDPVGHAVALAQAMARHDSEAVRVAKASLRAATLLEYDAGLRNEIAAFVHLHGREEARKRIQAFLEK